MDVHDNRIARRLKARQCFGKDVTSRALHHIVHKMAGPRPRVGEALCVILEQHNRITEFIRLDVRLRIKNLAPAG